MHSSAFVYMIIGETALEKFIQCYKAVKTVITVTKQTKKVTFLPLPHAVHVLCWN